MSTRLQFVDDLRADFADDTDESLLGELYAGRLAERSLIAINVDLSLPESEEYELDDSGEVVPDISSAHYSLWSLRAKLLACRYLQAKASNRVNFASGDKKMDRSREAANWRALYAQFKDEYQSLLSAENPDADSSIIDLGGAGDTYTRGIRTEEA